MVDVHKKQRTGSTTSDITDFSSRTLPLQRRRVWRACECCRRKKIKCDGHEPVCSQCTQTNSTCTWIQTKDRAALSRHYVQELEARLVQMEGLLTQVGSSPAPDQAHPDPPFAPSSSQQHLRQPESPPPSVVLNALPAPSTAPSYLMDPNIRPESAEPDHFGQLAMDGHGHLRWIGGSSAMTLVDAFRNISNTVRPVSRNDSSHPKFLRPEPKSAVNNLYFPSIIRFNSKARALPSPEEVEFPPRDLADKLVAAYFTHFHHTLPVVDSSAFLSQYRRIMDDRRIVSASDTGFPAVVFAVFACAARFVDDSRLEGTDPDAGEGGMAFAYYERAMILYYIGHTATQLAHVQAFVLLASFLASVNSLPQSWLMCGQAVRIAQDLGLHRSPRHLLLAPIDKEIRRKVWWCVYGLDRMLAVALGRPLGIEDADCDVELPLDIDDVALPKYFASITPNSAMPSSSTPATASFAQAPATVSLMKGFNALTCLWKIAGQVLRSVYALDKCKENLESDKMAELQVSVDRLDRLLSEWCDKLPPPFKSSPQTAQQVSLGAILCSCYYAITVTLHRNFIPTSLALRAIPRSSSVAKAVTASRSCIFLAQSIKDVIPSSHWLAFFSQYLFSSAIIILLCIMHATDQGAVNTAMNEVSAAVECLESLERSWPGAKKCKELLKELADLTLTKVRETVASSPAKRDRLMMAAESIMAENSNSGRKLETTELLPPSASTSGSLESPVNPQFTAANPSRKRPRAEDEEEQSVRLHLPNSFATTQVAAASPSSPYAAQQQTRQLPTPSPLGFGRREFPGDRAGSGTSSYALSSGSIASPSQYSARWSTPRTTAASIGGENAVSIDFTLPNPAVDGLESSGPFSLGTPSSSRAAPLDPTYLTQFAFPFYEDASLAAAPSPAQFDLTDLPFSGLDCLQNFGSLPDTSLDPAAPDSLWSQLSASPFKMGPDLPFGLADGQSTS